MADFVLKFSSLHPLARYAMVICAYMVMLLLFPPSLAQAGTVTVKDVQILADEGATNRLVIHLSQPTRYQLYTLEFPSRIVIDLKQSAWQVKTPLQPNNPVISSIRHGVRNKTDLRIVLDLKKESFIKSAFILDPNEKSSHRLVLDLVTPNYTPPQTTSSNEEELLPESEYLALMRPIPKPVRHTGPYPTPKPRKYKRPIIVIDAGHGGKDSGAIGRSGYYEKHITLKYAKALARALNKTGRYRTKLTRDTDHYITLRNRIRIAHQAKGDLFISFHADSHPNPKTRGLSVYTLSERASDKEAAALARHANKSSVISDIDLRQENKEVQSILIDLVQRDTKNKSALFAEKITAGFQKKINLLRRPHRFAGFRVLTSANIPSVLIELGYMSNRKEEKLLKTAHYKKVIIGTITKAIDQYFKQQQG